MAEAFTGWYVHRHGTEPDPEAVDALAEEWMEGTLPDTWHAVSPHRVEFQLALINDWIPDDPITVAAKALLPEWVRWHGEQAGLPEHLVDRGSLSPRAVSGRHRAERACGFGSSPPPALASHCRTRLTLAGTTLSGLVDAALRAELTRRELADHVVMLAEADDVERLRARAQPRSRALSAWKTGR